MNRYYMRLRSAPGSDQTGFADAPAVLDKLISIVQDKGIHPEDMEIIDVKTSKEIPAKAFIDMAVHTKGLDVVKSAHASSNSKQEPFGSIYDAEIDKYVTEAPVNMPPYKNDDMSFVQGVYNTDQTGNKYSGHGPSIRKEKIPGFNLEHELFQDEEGNLNIFHSVDEYADTPTDFKSKLKKFGRDTMIRKELHRKPLSFVSMRPFNDGYIVNSIASDPNSRNKGIAKQLFLALINYIGTPIYFGRQVSPQGKAFGDAMIKELQGQFRVVGYDQQTKQEFAVADTDSLYNDPEGGKQLPSMEPKDIQKAITNTKLIKLIPESFESPEAIIREHLLREAKASERFMMFADKLDTGLRFASKKQGEIAKKQHEKLFPEQQFVIGQETPVTISGQSQQQLASILIDATGRVDIGKAFLDKIWDLPMANIKNRGAITRNSDLAPNTPQQMGKPVQASYKVQDMVTMNHWLSQAGININNSFVITNIALDDTIPPNHGKNALKFDIQYFPKPPETAYTQRSMMNNPIKPVKEQYNKEKYPNLKDFAIMIKKHVGQAKAMEFYHIDWEHQNDANAEMLINMGTDPLDLDTDSANEWLAQHSVPYRVRRMFNDDQYEIYFDVLNTLEPVGGTSIH